MATFTVTKEQLEAIKRQKEYEKYLQEQKLLEQEDEQEFKTKNLTKNQRQQIRENIWYKLYMLQNYNITMDMFTGSDLRWSSIQTYLGYIRAIYQGKQYKEELRVKTLVNYIQGLIDSGTEPYPTIESQDKLVTIQELIDSKLLTPYEIKQIYGSVGITEELPDTSSAWTCSHHEHNRQGVEHNTYYTIVEERPSMTNPIEKPTLKTMSKNFLGFKMKPSSILDSFKLFRV